MNSRRERTESEELDMSATMRRKLRRPTGGLALSCALLSAALLGAPPVAADDAAASLEAQVIQPFRRQLDALNTRAREHADAIERKEVHEVRDPRVGVDARDRSINETGLDYPPGWVFRIVRPFEDDYFTTRRTDYEFLGWAWEDGAEGKEALLRYTETLFLKSEDSLEAIPSGEWQRWLSVEHRLSATRNVDGHWSVVETVSPTPTPDPSLRREFRVVPPS
jgi:hypothetical protein